MTDNLNANIVNKVVAWFVLVDFLQIKSSPKHTS